MSNDAQPYAIEHAPEHGRNAYLVRIDGNYIIDGRTGDPIVFEFEACRTRAQAVAFRQRMLRWIDGLSSARAVN